MQPIHIESIDNLRQLAGLATSRHPMISIIDVEQINQLPSQYPLDVSFGFYSIGLLKNIQGHVYCGRKKYDFDKGTMTFTSPHQLIGHNVSALVEASGWLLLFDRMYLAGHPLSDKILDYGFFDYAVSEALHISEEEEEAIKFVFENIQKEYHRPIDKYSKSVVLSNLDLLLTYCNRYYGRQFITRNEIESGFLQDFDHLLNLYFKSNDLDKKGLPNISYFGEAMNMSNKYLSDKLKVLSGKTAQEHIHLKLLENAKVLLKQDKLSVSEIAYQLGFEYPQYFSRFFKKKMGLSPKAFRVAN